MQASTTEAPEFTPPADDRMLRPVALAVLAHVVLVLALSWGVQWKHDDQTLAVEAELWASTPQQAAPKPVEAPPAPPPPQPAPPPPAPAPAPAQREADIALQQEKERKEQEEAKQAAEAERQRQRAAEKREAEKMAAEKREAEERRKQEARKQEQERQLAEKRKREAEEKRKEEQARARAKQEEERLARLRKENLERIQGLAGATGPRDATGTALRSAGPSSSYAGRIRARVKPNIVFTDDVPGNPTAVVEVRLAPDGTIVGKRIVKTSGVKTWDDAVLRALDRTEVLPRDVDGRVITPLELVFRPKD